MQKASNDGLWPHLSYVDNTLDRAAERRRDASFLDDCARQDTCGFYLIGGEMIVLKQASGQREAVFRPEEIAVLSSRLQGTNGEVAERIFLGLQDKAPRFGLSVTFDLIESLKADSRFLVTDLRAIAAQGLVAPEHLAPLAEAKALMHWHARHRFCSNCGHATNFVEGGWRRDCPQCKFQHLPRTDPVAIMLAVRGDHCLLGRQSRFLPGMWSCLAGFVEPGETIEEAARREILEEAGIRCGRVRYFASQPWPFPSSLMIGCHADAISHEIVVDRNELEDARWVSRGEAAAMLTRTHPEGLCTPAPFAIAYHIIRAWLEKGDDVFA
jgi:NAD+ diphosphatase